MKKLIVKTGDDADFFKRGRKLAQLADKGQALPEESVISFEDLADVLKLLTFMPTPPHQRRRRICRGRWRPSEHPCGTGRSGESAGPAPDGARRPKRVPIDG